MKLTHQREPLRRAKFLHDFPQSFAIHRVKGFRQIHGHIFVPFGSSSLNRINTDTANGLAFDLQLDNPIAVFLQPPSQPGSILPHAAAHDAHNTTEDDDGVFVIAVVVDDDDAYDNDDEDDDDDDEEEEEEEEKEVEFPLEQKLSTLHIQPTYGT
ncbi:unnamed protein product [Schistocephalus solidus]|uniref:Uncharacterized protein n=1 Tax=Schistocephalus solidus TaxID=70667 RepID=A0A183SKE7_SCHSO|nr:unnamed protein product [Schistocephalus solidus]